MAVERNINKERERGTKKSPAVERKTYYKETRCQENEINKQRDLKGKRCVQKKKKTQKRESSRDKMPREKDAKSREKTRNR